MAPFLIRTNILLIVELLITVGKWTNIYPSTPLTWASEAVINANGQGVTALDAIT